MKRAMVFLLTAIFLLFNISVAFAEGKSLQKARYIDSIEIDGNKISSTTKTLIEITEYNQNLNTSTFVLSGKGSESTEISIYTKKNKKEPFGQDNLVDKITVGKSGYFAKKIDVSEGNTYILVVATKDKDTQLAILRVYYEKKESFLTKVEKAISNLINSITK
ncbi:hypothetical protein OTJ99_002401 [Caldicellulosiruptor naganoensis]|uniref:Uncharacterized protein n=2 Tax=Caldicellulosiruptor naganoensis TaxID=29324 RepID=A0ABY7BL12_9FIRM|nr:hypothetical protein [Caldicellulosiruptor naganoensis]WAM32756.1 hypothetical protein OTJ99_002401 [Caldicellulosiruptor naganoensis]